MRYRCENEDCRDTDNFTLFATRSFFGHPEIEVECNKCGEIASIDVVECFEDEGWENVNL